MGLSGSLRLPPPQPQHRGPGMHFDADFADTAEALPQVSQSRNIQDEQTPLLGAMETGNDWRLTAIGEIKKDWALTMICRFDKCSAFWHFDMNTTQNWN